MKKSKDDVVIDVISPVVVKPQSYIVSLVSNGNILFDKMPDLSVPKAEKKDQAKTDPIQSERDNWREKLYFDSEMNVVIPGENIHEALKDAARYWKARVPGEGKCTYTDIVSKAMIVESMYLFSQKRQIKKDDEDILPFGKMCNGNPSRGKKSGTKVYKIRPLISAWQGDVKVHVLDGRITMDVLSVLFTYAGVYIKLCSWREKYGAFTLKGISPVEIV